MDEKIDIAQKSSVYGKYVKVLRKVVGYVLLVLVLILFLVVVLSLLLPRVKISGSARVGLDNFCFWGMDKIRIIPTQWWPLPKYKYNIVTNGEQYEIGYGTIEGFSGSEDDLGLEVVLLSGENVFIRLNEDVELSYIDSEYDVTTYKQFNLKKVQTSDFDSYYMSDRFVIFEFDYEGLSQKNILRIVWNYNQTGREVEAVSLIGRKEGFIAR